MTSATVIASNAIHDVFTTLMEKDRQFASLLNQLLCGELGKMTVVCFGVKLSQGEIACCIEMQAIDAETGG